MEKFGLNFKKTVATGWGWFWWACGLWIVGIVLAIIGILAEATTVSFGLEAMSYYLLSICSFLAGILVKITWIGALLVKQKEEK